MYFNARSSDHTNKQELGPMLFTQNEVKKGTETEAKSKKYLSEPRNRVTKTEDV